MSEVPFAYLEDDYIKGEDGDLCNCCQTESLRQAMQELDDLVEYQTRIIQAKNKLIDELTKENKEYKRAYQNQVDKANKDEWDWGKSK